MTTLGTCELRSLATVGLGFKSLQNHFFYLTQEEIDRYSIESNFLRPIFTMKDLDANNFYQSETPNQWVFFCSEREADIKGTGALKYIQAMEHRQATEKKQTGKPQTIKEVLTAQGGGVWYAPKATLHEANIWLRKAFNTSFNPFLFGNAVAFDQRCNFLSPNEISWELLAAMLTSSLFVLAAESHGASSMGAGALELATRQLPDVKVVDIRGLNPEEAVEFVNLARTVWATEKAHDWNVGLPGLHMQALDLWLLTRLGKSYLQSKIYDDIRETCSRRVTVAKDKDVNKRRAVVADVGKIAAAIAQSVEPFLEAKQFPEAFSNGGADLTSFQLPAFVEVELHPLMTEAVLILRSQNGKTLMDQQLPHAAAQVIVKAIMLGRRQFKAPLGEKDSLTALAEFEPWIASIMSRINEACRLSSVGTQYEEQIMNSIMSQLGIEKDLSNEDFFGTGTFTSS